jgi:cell division protein ZapA (FtsZ GTPase activity inhibitor)
MLAGKEYRLRSDASEASLQQVASYVDRSMVKIRERTDTVDSLDIALLTALNLAREVLTLRGRADAESETRSSALDDVSDGQLRSLIEQVESELPSAETGRSG